MTYMQASTMSNTIKIDALLKGISRDKESILKRLNEISSDDLSNHFKLVSRHLRKKAALYEQKYGTVGASYLSQYIKTYDTQGAATKYYLSNGVVATKWTWREEYDNISVQKTVFGVPKGIVVHWLAGNVGSLSILSLIPGIVTRNINVLKPPSGQVQLVRQLVNDFLYPDGAVRKVSEVLSLAVHVVPVERENRRALNTLSNMADVRIAWGGIDAVKSILSLEKKWRTEDIVFGPRSSFAVIDQTFLSDNNRSAIARRLAMDVVANNQMGCNSPQRLFLVGMDEEQSIMVGDIINEALKRYVARYDVINPSGKEVFDILTARTIADMELDGESWHSGQHDYTYSVILTQSTSWSKPIFYRTLFMHRINALSEISKYMDPNPQSIGYHCDLQLLDEIVKYAKNQNMARIVPLGAMSEHDTPWDGMYEVDRLVDWLSVTSN